MDRFTKVTFNSSGSWTCPAGVTCILVWGMGGGASGGGSSQGSGVLYGMGGAGQHLQATILDVTPNTTYTITIGDGGTATTDPTGVSGQDTTFGALMTWKGAPARVPSSLGRVFGIFKYRSNISATNMVAYPMGGRGNVSPPYYGYPSRTGLSVAPGANSGSYYGGGGGMGGEGLGGAGGNAASSGVGQNGFSALPNTGAGGGGGGGGASGSSLGGAGGSAQMIIMWVE